MHIACFSPFYLYHILLFLFLLSLVDEDIAADYEQYLTPEVQEEVIYYSLTKSHMVSYFSTAISSNL